MTMRTLAALALGVLTIGATAVPIAFAAEEKAPTQVLFTNVNIFDGNNEKLATGMNLLVEGNKIKNNLQACQSPRWSARRLFPVVVAH